MHGSGDAGHVEDDHGRVMAFEPDAHEVVTALGAQIGDQATTITMLRSSLRQTEARVADLEAELAAYAVPTTQAAP